MSDNSVPIKLLFFQRIKQFVRTRANNFWQYGKHSFRKFDKFLEIPVWQLVDFSKELVQNLGHIHIFLDHWAQLFQKNLGTRQLSEKIEGTLLISVHTNKAKFTFGIHNCK